MRRAAVLALFCCFAAAQSSLPPEVLLLSRIRRGVAETLSRLPSYACLENVNRLARKSHSKRFRPTDTLRLEVIASGERELFSWPDSQFSNAADTLVPVGLTTSGEFYSSAKAVFLAGPAVIKYHGSEFLNGVRAARYDYRVSQAFSGYRLDIGGRRAIVGFSGSFWADPTNAELLRLSESADNIPLDLHTRSIVTMIDYSRVLLGGKPVRFPESARVDLIDDSGFEDQNLVEFTHCREYQAESNIDFNAAAPTLATDLRAASPVEFQVPPGLTFDVHLHNVVNFASSRIGDPVTAIIENDINSRKHLLAPRGAALTGRLRLLTRSLDPASPLIVGLEFTDIDFTDASGIRHHAPFYALLTGISPLPGISREISDSKTFRQDLLNLGFMETRNSGALDPPALPGVGTFFAEPPATSLPKGFAMSWVTVRLDRPER
ncbi:MAG TPA: hypothetical protein VN610_01405 [Bryobacteraceae bacterium]|nr:hypothetical protein [Bryobacteraceae bacterium]